MRGASLIVSQLGSLCSRADEYAMLPFGEARMRSRSGTAIGASDATVQIGVDAAPYGDRVLVLEAIDRGLRASRQLHRCIGASQAKFDICHVLQHVCQIPRVPIGFGFDFGKVASCLPLDLTEVDRKSTRLNSSH